MALVSKKRKRDVVDELADEVSDPESMGLGDLGDVDDLLSIHGSNEEPENDNENNVEQETEIISANRQCILTVDLVTMEVVVPSKHYQGCLQNWSK